MERLETAEQTRVAQSNRRLHKTKNWTLYSVIWRKEKKSFFVLTCQ